MIRFVSTVCPMPSTLLVSQYSTRPLGAHRNMNVKTTGMSIMIFCCVGSACEGVSRCWSTIDAPMMSGAERKQAIDRFRDSPEASGLMARFLDLVFS